MTQPLIPNQFLFRFALACRFRKNLPSVGERLLELPMSCRLPFFGAMDGQREFADIRMAWNDGGIGIQWETSLKEKPIHGDPANPGASDGLALWIDTRDTRTIHRASRHCSHFLFVAHDGETSATPKAFQKTIHRALENATIGDLSNVQIVRTSLTADGDDSDAEPCVNYRMEVYLPAATIPGFDPQTSSRLGIMLRVRDLELGDQILASSPELPYWEDPSLWCSLDLTK